MTRTLGLLAAAMMVGGMFACGDDSPNPIKKNKGGSDDSQVSDEDTEGDGEGGSKSHSGGSQVSYSGGSQNTSGGGSNNGGGGSSNSSGDKAGSDSGEKAGGGSSNKAGSSNKGGSSKGGSSNKGGDQGGGDGGSSKGTGGGSSSGSCTYDGSGKDSKVCTNGLCTEGSGSGSGSGDSGAASGSWQGYAYTYAFDACTKKQTYNPPCGDGSCFEKCGAKACVAGGVPASYDCGLGIGVEISHPSGGKAGTVAIEKDFQIQVSGAPSTARVAIVTSSDKEFCQPLPSGATSALTTVTLKKMVTNCYEGGTPQTAYAGEAIKAVQIYVPGDEKEAADVDMCLVDLKP